MAKTKLSPDMALSVKKEMAEIIERHFTAPDGTTLSEIKIAEALGISQPQLNEIRNKGENAGIKALLAMSKRSQKTVNQILGPTAPCYRSDERDAVVRAKTLELLDRMATSGFGFSGKNYEIPRLMSELRSLLGAPSEEAYRKQVDELAHKARAHGRPTAIAADNGNVKVVERKRRRTG